MTTNPSHILIARNSRGPHNPSASLSSPTETHAAASGIFRSSGSPPWVLRECEADDFSSDLGAEVSDGGAIDVDETFTKNSRFPGTVKIIVESTTFWVHKEVLFFASPFFEAALSGNWSETGRPPSISSVITISQPPSVPGSSSGPEGPTQMTFAPVDPDLEPEELQIIAESDAAAHDNKDEPILSPASIAQARSDSLAKLQAGASHAARDEVGSSSATSAGSEDEGRNGKSCARTRKPSINRPDAVIVLREERASTFHDFLKYVYPHLQCTITWNNVESLMNISHKLCVPSLQQDCLNFLLTHAAGKPIKAMRIAELFEEEELYREASRFVLDNPGGWSDQELNTLSKETLLKLEKRRTWFLERVLKLGLTVIAKEYQCVSSFSLTSLGSQAKTPLTQCPTCPDPSNCARLLEEKWRQAYHAVFRFGPPQPSMVYRYLRMLEGVSPPLSLTQTACQASAKAFTATLFDRMFSLGVRGSGTDTAPLGTRVAAAAGASTGPRRHFLYCALKPEPTKTRRSRDLT